MKHKANRGKKNASGGSGGIKPHKVSPEWVHWFVDNQHRQNGMEPPTLPAHTVETLTECFKKAEVEIMKARKLTKVERIAVLTEKLDGSGGELNCFETLRLFEAEEASKEHQELLEKSWFMVRLMLSFKK